MVGDAHHIRTGRRARHSIGVWGVLALLLMMVVPPQVAGAAGTLDQHFDPPPPYNGSVSLGYEQGVLGLLTQSQVFTAGVSGVLSQVDVNILPRVPVSSLMTVAIQSTSGGVPTGSTLGSRSLWGSDIPPSTGILGNFGSWVSVPLGVAVEAGTQYAITLVTGSRYDWTAGSGYTGGGLYQSINGGAWRGGGTSTALFRTYVTPTGSGMPSNPVPSLTGLNPGALMVGAPTTQITVTGHNFSPGAILQWGPVSSLLSLQGGQAASLPTTFVDDQHLTVTVPWFLLNSVISPVDVSVVNPAPGGGPSPASIPFFLTDGPTSVSALQVSTATGGTATVSAGTTTAAATGSGTVSLAQYTSDPVSTPNDGGGQYYDVYVGPKSTFSSLSVVFCNSGQLVSWWDGGQWSPASNQTFDGATGCVTVTIDTTTSPSTTQLKGTPFVVSKMTAAIVKTLIDTYCGDASVRNALKVQVDSIAKAPNAVARAGALRAFTASVNAQAGKTLTAQQAQTLVKYAGVL